jgi:hypothetical protein
MNLPSSISQVARTFFQKGWQLIDPLSRSFDDALSSARKRAASRAWAVPELSRPIAYADMRALSVATAITLSELTPDKRPSDLYSDRWGSALARTYDMLAKSAGYKNQTISDVKSAASKDKAAIPVIEIVAIVIGALAVAAVIGFVIYEIAQVVDRALARQPANEELVRLHSEAEKIVEDHLEAERKAGHPIPWSQAELDALERLERQQAIIIHGITPKGESPAIEPVSSTGLVLGVLGLGALGFFAWRKGWI